MNLIRLLEEEHAALLDGCKMIEMAIAEGRPIFAGAWLDHVCLHGRAEESVVYAMLRAREAAVRIVSEAIADHHEIERLAHELMQLPLDDARWVPELESLAEKLRAHILEEEDVLLKKLRKIFHERELDLIGRDFRAFMTRNLAA